MGARRLDKLEEVQKTALIKHPDSPGQIVYTKCDVTQRESVCDLVKEAEEQLGDVDVIINNNALTGAWTDATPATPSNSYVEGSFSTAPGIIGAKEWLTALSATAALGVATVTYSIEIDDADAALAADASDSTAINGTSVIDTAAELGLLPSL